MKKIIAILSMVSLIFFVHVGDASAETTTWDFSTSGNYTLSDNGKIEIDGTVGKIRRTALNPSGVIIDNGTTELNGAGGFTIVGNYAYVTAREDDGLEILDISDPTNPIHVGAITDDVTTELDGAYDVEVIGDYAYVGSYYDDGIEILDISTPATPVHVGAITDTGVTELDGVTSLVVVGDYAYITGSLDDGVEILDISNPAAPTHVGAITDDGTTALDGAYGIQVIGDYAYISSYYDDGLEILDISNPAAPTHVGSLTDDGTKELDAARSIQVVGDYAYIPAILDDGLEIIDISNPAAPVSVGNIADDGTTELFGATTIAISGDYGFVTGFFDNGVEVLDISDPTNPTHMSGITDTGATYLIGPVHIEVVGNYAYVSTRTDDSFQILSIDYHDDAPYITPNTSESFNLNITSFTADLGSGNEGTVTFQVSTDNGTTWYYQNGGTWQTTTATDGTETSSASTINDSIIDLDGDGGDFLWRAFLNSDGSQQVELDSVSITTRNPRNSSHRTFSCKDINATNYSQFGTHDQSLCEYTIGESTHQIQEILGSGVCSNELIITENLRKGTRNGQYDSYQGGIVNQVDILQEHINRILAAQYQQAAGPIDGIFGPLTKQGVERLQTALNEVLKPEPLLVIDGIVGPFTKAAINNSCGNN